MQIRPNVISIAGFDPCGGAGVLADIKTFEACNVYGMGVVSAITYQNDNTFGGLKWCSVDEIIKQLDLLTAEYKFDYYKVGIIESPEILSDIIMYFKEKQPDAKCVWDPVLKASAGYVFHNNIDKNKLDFILKNCCLITPNKDEAMVLFDNNISIDNIRNIIKSGNYCPVLLKGGHSEGNEINDVLIEKDNFHIFEGVKFENFAKHGTGCVLSSAITSFLAKAKSLKESCETAKNYIHDFITSNNTNLGYHNNLKY